MKTYSIRKLTTNNKTGDALGMTLPKDKIMDLFITKTQFTIERSGGNIILKSGLFNEESFSLYE